jgi:DNA-binding response OmpR family regulator
VSSPRILLVEDEPALARGLLDNLRAEGFDARLVGRGDRVLQAVEELDPDGLVLDIMLPGRSGLEVLKDLRARRPDLPVLLLSAKGELVDRVVGLELGADDYLPKPFALQELLARVRALLRRARSRPNTLGPPARLHLGEVSFDFAGLLACGPTGALDLTPHSILVLKVLAERRGEVVSRADIVEEVRGLDTDATLRIVDNHIVALRRAVGDDPRRPRWLHTIRGIGYRLARE